MGYKSILLNTSALTSQSNSLANTPSLMMVNPDTEPVIEIDADLRKITIPQQLYNIGVVGDHLCEVVHFNCPRYFDGNDLSKHTCIIRFINAGNEYGESSVVDILAESDTLHFGWALDNYVTRYSGIVQFTVQFETENDGIKYQWQTTPATLNIMAGLNNIEETITDKDDLLFRSLTNQIQSLQKSVESLNSMKKQLDKLIINVEKLKDNVVYIHDDNSQGRGE